MNCVYDAWVAHMLHLGFDRNEVDTQENFEYFSDLRVMIDSPSTDSRMVPVIMNSLSRKYTVEAHIQTRFLGTEQYVELMLKDGYGESFADRVRNNFMLANTRLVNEIDLEPAIYCMLGSKHAHFGLERPLTKKKDFAIMAIQLRPKGGLT